VCACVQSQSWFTTSRARNVTVILTLVALIYDGTYMICWYLARIAAAHVIVAVVFRVAVPLAVVVINVVVAVQVRRAASNAAANLGVQSHHQQTSTSNNSAVPTVMLVATSIVYALICGTLNILNALRYLEYHGGFAPETAEVIRKCAHAAFSVKRLVFAYNFYVYLTTGRQFRAELYRLFCCRISSPAPTRFADATDASCSPSRHVQTATTF